MWEEHSQQRSSHTHDLLVNHHYWKQAPSQRSVFSKLSCLHAFNQRCRGGPPLLLLLERGNVDKCLLFWCYRCANVKSVHVWVSKGPVYCWLMNKLQLDFHRHQRPVLNIQMFRLLFRILSQLFFILLFYCEQSDVYSLKKGYKIDFKLLVFVCLVFLLKCSIHLEKKEFWPACTFLYAADRLGAFEML